MDILELRKNLQNAERHSHTTLQFQDDLLSFLEDSYDKGQDILEIGCYHGGMTVQLASIAKRFGKMVDVVDIDQHYLSIAKNTVEKFGLSDFVRFHLTDLKSFCEARPDYPKAVCIFVDGDHRYDGVVADIRAIKALKNKPFSIAFHDFSLRYADGPLSNVRVDKAILDEFGQSITLTPIGEIAGEGSLRTVPTGDRHFHETGVSEGVVVVM